MQGRTHQACEVVVHTATNMQATVSKLQPALTCDKKGKGSAGGQSQQKSRHAATAHKVCTFPDVLLHIVTECRAQHVANMI